MFVDISIRIKKSGLRKMKVGVWLISQSLLQCLFQSHFFRHYFIRVWIKRMKANTLHGANISLFFGKWFHYKYRFIYKIEEKTVSGFYVLNLFIFIRCCEFQQIDFTKLSSITQASTSYKVMIKLDIWITRMFHLKWSRMLNSFVHNQYILKGKE